MPDLIRHPEGLQSIASPLSEMTILIEGVIYDRTQENLLSGELNI